MKYSNIDKSFYFILVFFLLDTSLNTIQKSHSFLMVGVTIINGITGEVFTTPLEFFTTLEEMKTFIAARFSLQIDQLFILLPDGFKLTADRFDEEIRRQQQKSQEHSSKEYDISDCIVVFNREVFSLEIPRVNATTDNMIDRPSPADTIEIFLDSVSNSHSVEFIKPRISPLSETILKFDDFSKHLTSSLITTNMGWLSALEIDVKYFNETIDSSVIEMKMILKALKICYKYMGRYCEEVDDLYKSNNNYLTYLKTLQSSESWENMYTNILGNINDIDNKPLTNFLNRDYLEKNGNEMRTLKLYLDKKFNEINLNIAENRKEQVTINKQIQDIEKNFMPDMKKYDLESTMSAKFVDLKEKLYQEQQETLSELTTNFHDSAFKESTFRALCRIKDNDVKTLYTIAQALFVQTREIIAIKRKLQRAVIQSLSQIAGAQVNISELRKDLLTHCNEILSDYQNYQLIFAKLDDLPVVYGLCVIELFRRNFWSTKILEDETNFTTKINAEKDKELVRREKWLQNFNDFTAELTSKLLNETDSYKVINMYLGRDPIALVQELGKERKMKVQKVSDLESFIRNYIYELEKIGFSKEITKSLSKIFEEITLSHFSLLTNKNHITLPNHNKTDLELQNTSNTVLLNIPEFSSSNEICAFKSSRHIQNGSTINQQIYDIDNYQALKMELKNMKKSLQESLLITKEKENELSKLQSEISDNKVEKLAYRETLSSLNKELSKLIIEKELAEKNTKSKEQIFQKQINDVIEENKNLRECLADSNEKHNNVKEENILIKKELIKYKDHISDLKDDIDKSKMETTAGISSIFSNLRILNERLIDNIPGKENVPLNIIEEKQALVSACDTSKTTNNDTLLPTDCKHLIDMIYKFFKSNVGVLENIGLLLESNSSGQLQIVRVKGLRKVNGSRTALDSAQLIDLDADIKSEVFNKIEEEYNKQLEFTDVNTINYLLQPVNALFNDHLYEYSVIRRFKDIEMLAKRLTKENKSRKNAQEVMQKEKVTLKDFKEGDLALFLPISDSISSNELKKTSTNSSFSSIDLSTPPTFDIPLNRQTSSVLSTDNPTRKNGPGAWAAFTAFEESRRYMLKEDATKTEGKDWIIGCINSIKPIITTDVTNNPLRMPLGSVWFQITAEIITTS